MQAGRTYSNEKYRLRGKMDASLQGALVLARGGVITAFLGRYNARTLAGRLPKEGFLIYRGECLRPVGWDGRVSWAWLSGGTLGGRAFCALAVEYDSQCWRMKRIYRNRSLIILEGIRDKEANETHEGRHSISYTHHSKCWWVLLLSG